MGELATTGEPGHMDAFHVPSVLVRSDGTLRPGDSVRFVDDPPTRVERCAEAERHGVADPLLKGAIPAGSLVWVAVEPALVVGVLSHYFRVSLSGSHGVSPAPVPAAGGDDDGLCRPGFCRDDGGD